MSNGTKDPRRAELGSRILVTFLVGIFLFGIIGFAIAVIDAGQDDAALPARPSLPAGPVLPSPEPTPDSALARSRILVALAVPSLSPSPSRSPFDPTATELPVDPSDAPGTASAPDAATTPAIVPIVPVTRFWSRAEGLSRDGVADALERGTSAGASRVVVEDTVADALAAELGVEIHADVVRGGPQRVERAVRKGALGLVAALDVTPSMRMLEVDGLALAGNGRIRDVSDWPLSVTIEQAREERWDQSRTWVLVAGGDSFTDRGVYDTVVRKGKGVDYPFAGGTARVTGHGCCDPVFGDNVVPRYVLTGNRGLVRKLFRDAELAIANHEQPVTEAADFHRSGTRFSGRPDLTRIFTRAGIDYLSLANNHIKDYGADGIADTRRILRRHGIAFGGAGKDLAQARKASHLRAGDTDVAIVPCLGIVRAYWAGPRESGATPCLDRYIVPDIKAARRAGADVVIVFPHWGVEYTRQPLPSMRRHAARWVKAGADLVIGAHSHVAGSVEDIDGTPVLYSLGNLIFDQHWSTNTMESALLEATFHGDQLVEMRLRPYIIHDTSQPNLLDAARGEGRRLLQSIRKASSGWLDW